MDRPRSEPLRLDRHLVDEWTNNFKTLLSSLNLGAVNWRTFVSRLSRIDAVLKRSRTA